MIKQLYGTKQGMTQAFTDEARITMTKIQLFDLSVSKIITNEKDGYSAIQLGFGGKKRNSSKALKNQFKSIKHAPKYSREVLLDQENEDEEIKLGTTILAKDILKLGDILNIQGTTKGKGFAGAIKRWGFSRQPKTHGQSDRVRATGSIGQGTDPGRVHKGKKMPGRMGSKTYTVKQAQVIYFNEKTNEIWVTGHIPGNNNGLLRLIIKSHKTPPKLVGVEQETEKPENKEVKPKEEKPEIEDSINEEKTVNEKQDEKTDKKEPAKASKETKKDETKEKQATKITEKKPQEKEGKQ